MIRTESIIDENWKSILERGVVDSAEWCEVENLWIGVRPCAELCGIVSVQSIAPLPCRTLARLGCWWSPWWAGALIPGAMILQR
jgi:hypothetical protein